MSHSHGSQGVTVVYFLQNGYQFHRSYCVKLVCHEWPTGQLFVKLIIRSVLALTFLFFSTLIST